jgi:hypothetical protein
LFPPPHNRVQRMAASIPAPWICDYLIDVGERHGGHLSDVPLWVKKKKAHLREVRNNTSFYIPNHLTIIQFLIYEQSKDECIWAKISDNVHGVPVKLTNEAVKEYDRCVDIYPLLVDIFTIQTFL